MSEISQTGDDSIFTNREYPCYDPKFVYKITMVPDNQCRYSYLIIEVL